MKKQILMPVLSLALVTSLTACGAKIEKAEANPTPHDTYKGEGLFSGKSGNILDGFNKGKDGNGGVYMSMPVNVYLWRSSLEAISFMPLTSASVQDGVIITDWYANPNKMSERVKVNVYVMGQDFVASNLKVSMFKQQQKNGAWVDVAVDPQTVSELEETILTNARALRVKVRAAQ